MYDFSGIMPFVEEDEAPVTEPLKPCAHLKVYAARNEGPYPWICCSCLEQGEDVQYPVCDSRLYQELVTKATGGALPEGPGKLRACYYCGKLVVGHFSDQEPVRCGKCF